MISRRALLTDPEAEVRLRAIRLLDECDDVKLISTFLKILAGRRGRRDARRSRLFAGKIYRVGRARRASRQRPSIRWKTPCWKKPTAKTS